MTEPDPSSHPTPPEPLEYRAPEADGYRAPRTFSILSFMKVSVVMLIILILLTHVVPRLEIVFKDFGTPLPFVTVGLLSLSHLFAGTGGMIFGVIIALSLGVMVGMMPIRGKMLQLILMLVIGLIVVVIALALLLPLVGMMDSLTQGVRKR
jgi:type II secretory pathway component PulF